MQTSLLCTKWSKTLLTIELRFIFGWNKFLFVYQFANYNYCFKFCIRHSLDKNYSIKKLLCIRIAQRHFCTGVTLARSDILVQSDTLARNDTLALSNTLARRDTLARRVTFARRHFSTECHFSTERHFSTINIF